MVEVVETAEVEVRIFTHQESVIVQTCFSATEHGIWLNNNLQGVSEAEVETEGEEVGEVELELETVTASSVEKR